MHELLRQDVLLSANFPVTEIVASHLSKQDILLFANFPVTEFVASHLSKLYEWVQDVQLGMRTNDGSQHTLYELPKSFTAAFQQLLMLFVVTGNMAELYEGNLSNLDFVPKHRLQRYSKTATSLLCMVGRKSYN